MSRQAHVLLAEAVKGSENLVGQTIQYVITSSREVFLKGGTDQFAKDYTRSLFRNRSFLLRLGRYRLDNG